MAKRQDILNMTSGAEGRESLGFREEGRGERKEGRTFSVRLGHLELFGGNGDGDVMAWVMQRLQDTQCQKCLLCVFSLLRSGRHKASGRAERDPWECRGKIGCSGVVYAMPDRPASP